RVIDRIEINGTFSESEASRLREQLKPLEGTPLQVDQFRSQLKSAAQAAGVDVPMNFSVFSTGQDRARVIVTVPSPFDQPLAPAFADGGQGARVVATPFGNVTVGATPTPFGPRATGNPQAEIGKDVLAAEQLSTVLPEYPALAKQSRIQ